MDELEKLRREIDAVDAEIVRAFEERIRIAEQVAECKIEKGLPVLDRKREAELLKKREEMLTDKALSSDIDRVYELLMSLSRAHQRRLVREKTESGRKHVMAGKAGYSGLPGAYADMARDLYFNGQAEAVSYQGFDEVFSAVEAGEIAFGVVPIENSYAGSVLQVYDLMDQYNDVCIVGEQLVHIDHALLGVPGAKVSDIREVYSHDQGLMQCAGFLDGYPEWKRIPYYNTAASAEYVAKAGDVSKAAIASEYAGWIYGLKVLKSAVNTSGENTTRFIVIGTDKKTAEEGADKASLSFVLEHKPGALAHVLNVFAKRELNMVKIESRPLKHRNFEYRFYVDFVGPEMGLQIEKVIPEITPYCTQLKLLGIYRNGC